MFYFLRLNEFCTANRNIWSISSRCKYYIKFNYTFGRLTSRGNIVIKLEHVDRINRKKSTSLSLRTRRTRCSTMILRGETEMSVSTTLTMPSTTSFLAAKNTTECRKYNAGALSMIKHKNSKKHTTRYKYVTASRKRVCKQVEVCL